MQWVALAIGLSFVAAFVVAMFIPLRLALTAKGHGEFGKFWAFAAGGQLWFVTVSYANALGIDSIIQVHVFNRRVVHISSLRRKLKEEVDERKPTSFAELKEKWRRLREKIERRLELKDVLRFVVGLLRQVRMERFQGKFSYATPDVALTGVLSGSLFTLAGLLAPFGVLRVEPQWVDVAKAAGNFDVAFRFYPARMVLFATVFAIKNIKLRQRTRPDPVPAQT
ncbi:MAG: hypothetical protein ACOC1F_01410 [Myxococcota bacterium]